MRVYENGLLNTFYFLPTDKKIYDFCPFYFTINPRFLSDWIKNIPYRPIYHLSEQEFLYVVPREDGVSSQMLSPHSFIMLDNPYMILPLQDKVCIQDWLETNWNRPFLVTNPFYQLKENDTKYYIFSNRHGKTLCFEKEDRTDIDLYHFAIDNGCFSIGNGIIMALSLVSEKIWKEEDFLIHLTMFVNQQLQQTMNSEFPLYHSLNNRWTEYIFKVPYHIVDHLFKYAFLFNSPRIYRYLYSFTEEDATIMHSITGSSTRYVTSIFTYAKTPSQFQFLQEFPKFIEEYHHMVPNVSPIYPRLHINMYIRLRNILDSRNLSRNFLRNSFAFQFFQQFIYLNPRQNTIRLVQAISTIYPTLSKQKKRVFVSIWRKIIRTNHALWEHSLYLYLINVITVHYTSQSLDTIVPICPIKLIRDTIFQKTNFRYFFKNHSIMYLTPQDQKILSIPLSYTIKDDIIKIYASWKDIFYYCKEYMNVDYTRIIEKRIVHKLASLEKAVEHTSNGYLITCLMKEYYEKNKEDLWK